MTQARKRDLFTPLSTPFGRERPLVPDMVINAGIHSTVAELPPNTILTLSETTMLGISLKCR